MSASGIEQLKQEILRQLRARNVGYLLGAGASYFDGKGYPLASTLWNEIAPSLDETDREAIDEKIVAGANGLEEALDLLDQGDPDFPLRRKVAHAIGEHFSTVDPPLEHHACFARGLGGLTIERTQIFSLNYDPLIELGAEAATTMLIDGFTGYENPYFEPELFQRRIMRIGTPRRRPTNRAVLGVINLYKLHGSLGWYRDDGGQTRRMHHNSDPLQTELMIPPQYRKAADTIHQPYAPLWTEFRDILAGESRLELNRLFVIGYGLQDEHVNVYIENALDRSNFTVFALAKELSDAVFDRWSRRTNVVLVTETRTSLYGAVGEGHPEIWRFEWLAKELGS